MKIVNYSKFIIYYILAIYIFKILGGIIISNSVSCIVGIDGGGTKCVAKVVDLENNHLCTIIYNKSTNLCSNSKEEVYTNLQNLFKEIAAKVGKNLNYVGVCLGTAGISKANAYNDLKEMLQNITKTENIYIVGDMEIPLSAYSEKENAIGLICGTGSICYGKNLSGKIARSGGWGHIFSDEGSAYWLGCSVLNAVMKEFDKRGSKTLLTPLLLKYLNINNPEEIIQNIYKEVFRKDEIGKLAILLQDGADSNDAVSLLLLKTASEELFQLVKSVACDLELENEKFNLILSGSTVLKNKYIKNYLVEILKDNFASVNILEILSEPVDGAVHIGRRFIISK